MNHLAKYFEAFSPILLKRGGGAARPQEKENGFFSSSR
jgi:hypothetical protein